MSAEDNLFRHNKATIQNDLVLIAIIIVHFTLGFSRKIIRLTYYLYQACIDIIPQFYKNLTNLHIILLHFVIKILDFEDCFYKTM